MSPCGHCAGTYVALGLFAVLISSPVSAAPVYEDDVTTAQSQLAEYPGEGSTRCYYNFKHYEEGDRIITNEPCLNCTCHKRMLMCYLRVCPFTKAIGQDCKVEKKPDQCCPVITCPEVPVKLLTSSTTPEPTISSQAVGHPDSHGCTLGDSTFYPDGAQVPQDPNKPCELCYCIRNRTACVMQECTLNVEGCRPVYQDGVCCPVRYDCDYDEAPTTERASSGGLILSTTPSPLGCTYNGEIYNDGELIVTKTQKPCEHCYCMRGDIVCAVRSCGTPLKGKDCEPVPPPEGECCPTTYKCANGTVPLDSMSLIMDTLGLKPEESVFQKPNEHPEDESLSTPEPESDKIHDSLNNQHSIKTPLAANDDTPKPEKLPDSDSNVTDKNESESPNAQDKLEAEPQSPEEHVSQTSDSLHEQVSSDGLEAGVEDEGESDYLHPQTVQDVVEPSGNKVSDPNIGIQETSSSIGGVTPVRNNDGIQQIHVGQIDDLVTEIPVQENVNLATSAPKFQDDSEPEEAEQKPNDPSPTDESNPLAPGDSESVSKPQSSNEQEITQQVDLDNKPVIKNDDTTNEDVIKPQVSAVESDLPEITDDAKGTDKPDNDFNKPELGNKDKIETTGNIDSNEIIKTSQQEEDQSKEKPSTGNEVESEKRPDGSAQEQPSDVNVPLQSVSQESDEKQQVSEETELNPENDKTETTNESESVGLDTNKHQDSDTKETGSEEEHKSQETQDSDTKETSSEEEHKSQETQDSDTKQTSSEEEHKIQEPQDSDIKQTSSEEEHKTQETQDSDTKETSGEEEHKTQESTESQTPVALDSESVISDETETASDDDEISTESNEKTEVQQNKPTTQSVENEQSVAEDHEIKLHDSTPEGTVQNVNKPEDTQSIESVPSEDGAQNTELTKPEENISQVSVSDELSNDVSKTKDPEHEHTQNPISDELSNDVSKTKDSDSEHSPDPSDVTGKPQETEKLTGDQTKPLATNKPDEVQVQEPGNVQTDETEKSPDLVGLENQKDNENVSAGETETKPSDENVILSSPEVGNQKLDHSDTKPSSKFEVSETKPEDTVTEGHFVTETQTAEDSSDSDISPVNPIKDSSVSVEKSTVPTISDEKPAEHASTVLEGEDIKPTDSVSSESSEAQNTEEKLTSPKADGQSEGNPTVGSEGSQPTSTDEVIKPQDNGPIQTDVIEEQSESEELSPTVEVSTGKTEGENENAETEISTKVPSINEKESSSESTLSEEGSVASDKVGNSQDTTESDQHSAQVETSGASIDKNENKLPETIQSVSQDATNENLSPIKPNINPNEVIISNSESSANEDSTEKQSDISSISHETNLHDENQKGNELHEKKPTLGESSSNTDNTDEKLDQPSEENKPIESEINNEEDSISETPPSEPETPIKTDETSKPNEDVTIATISNPDKLDDNKHTESPASTNIPDQSQNAHGTDDESNTDKHSPPILHDFIESSEFDEEEEQPVIPETSSETDTPIQGVEDTKEESKPENQSNVLTDTKVETSAPLDQVTSNTKLDSENSPVPEAGSSEINKPQDQKEILPGSDKVQDVQTPSTTEVKHDNENKHHTIESPATNEISNDHKIIFEAEPGHGGIIHDLKETIDINFPGPAGILEQEGIPGEGSCLVDGKTYNNNSNVPSSNVCHRECKCISSVVHCFGIPCAPPPADMDNCMPVKQGDSCCPSYACDANVTPGSLEAQNQMGNEENAKDEQKPQPDDVVPTASVESDKPDKTSEVNNEDKIVPPSPTLPESSVSVQPTVTSGAESVKGQDEVSSSGENIKNESPSTQVSDDGLPAEEEGTVHEISETIDDSKLQTSDSILPSVNDQSADRVHSTDQPIISLEQIPLTVSDNVDSTQTQNVQPSDLGQSSENIPSSPIPDEAPTVETSIINEQNNVPLPTSEGPSDVKHTSSEQDESVNSSEGSPESTPNNISNEETIPKDSEPNVPEPELEKGDNIITPTEVPVEKPADSQNIVDKPTTSENEDSKTPVDTPTDNEPQNVDDKVNNLSVAQEQIKPQETPVSHSTENDNSQEPSGTTDTFGDEQPTTEPVAEEEQPVKEKEKSPETLSQDKLESSDTLNKPIPPQSTSNEGDDISEPTTASENGQTLVHEIPALPNISDDTSVQFDNPESENSDLEHIAPVFEIIEPNSQEEVVDQKPTESSVKDSGEGSSEKFSTTVGSQGEVSVTTPSSDNKEQNTNHGTTESVPEKTSDDTKNDVESSSKLPSSFAETPEDTATITPLSDNNEPNVVHETNESDDKKTEDPNDFQKPSSGISDSTEDSPTISPSPSAGSELPVEPVNVAEDTAQEIPSEVTSSVQKPSEEPPLVSELPVISVTEISSSDDKKPSNDETIDSLNNVQESSDSEPSKPDKGSDSTLESEGVTEIPNKEEENAVQSKPSSPNADDISATNNAEQPISNDEVVSGAGIKPETLEANAADHSSSNDGGESNQDEKGTDKQQISEINKPEQSSGESQPGVNVDNELPTISNIDPEIIMDHKTETPDISGVSSSEHPISPPEELTPNTSNENDKAETPNPLDSSNIDISTNDETKLPTHVEHDVSEPIEHDELPVVQSGELPDKSDLSESVTDQKVETVPSLPVEENQSNEESDQPEKAKDPNQIGNENEKEGSEIKDSTPTTSDSTSDETKPTEGQGTPVNVAVIPSADEIIVENVHSSEPSSNDNTSPVSTEEGKDPVQPESENLVTKSPEILTEKDETNAPATPVSSVDSSSEQVSSVDTTNGINPNIQGSEVSFDSETDDSAFTPPETDSSLTKEPKPPSPSEPSEDTTSEKTETNPALQELKPTETEIASSDKDVPSEAEAINVDASKGDSNEVVNTFNENNAAESVTTEKPDVSIASKPATISPSTSAEADQTPLQTLTDNDSEKTPVDVKIPEATPNAQEASSSSEAFPIEENVVTESAHLIPTNLESEIDVKPVLHQTVIAETSSVHASSSSSPKLPETEEQKPDSLTNEGGHVDDDKITFPEVTDDSVQTSAPPSLMTQEAFNELTSGQHISPQKPLMPQLPSYFPNSDSGFGPLPMPGWTPKPYIPETSSEESNTDDEEEHSPEGDMDYGGNEEGAFGPGTCRYGGKVYVSAQQIPRDDPCDFCFCFRSDIICLQQSCPPPIHRCRQESIKGFCCPRYECPVSMATTVNLTTTTTTTTTTLPPHFFAHAYKGAAKRTGCVVRGLSYQVGDEIKSASGPCLQCICGADGQMQCDPKICSPEPMLRKMMEAAVSRRRR